MEKVDPLVGKHLGNYRLEHKLGQGSCGVVYRAVHRKLGTPFAVKILHPILANDEESSARFLREAQTAARIAHENVVFIADFDIEPAIGPYFVMEYLDGRNFREVLAQEAPLDIERVAALSEQICHALASAHRIGVVHRDLKPANIHILPRSGRELLKILDFGIAKLMTASSSSEEIKELTRSGRILGTPRYFSPEQAQGLVEIDHRSDIYSFGIILFEMLMGYPPFDGTTPEEMILQHISADPAPLDPDKFPSELQDLMDWLLAKKPDERPDDMEEVWYLLKEALPLTRKVSIPAEQLQETQRLQGFTKQSLARSPFSSDQLVEKTTGYVESSAVVDLPGIERTIPLGADIADLGVPLPSTSSFPSASPSPSNTSDMSDFERAFSETPHNDLPEQPANWSSELLPIDDDNDEATKKQRLSEMPSSPSLPDIDSLPDDDFTQKQSLDYPNNSLPSSPSLPAQQHFPPPPSSDSLPSSREEHELDTMDFDQNATDKVDVYPDLPDVEEDSEAEEHTLARQLADMPPEKEESTFVPQGQVVSSFPMEPPPEDDDDEVSHTLSASLKEIDALAAQKQPTPPTFSNPSQQASFPTPLTSSSSSVVVDPSLYDEVPTPQEQSAPPQTPPSKTSNIDALLEESLDDPFLLSSSPLNTLQLRWQKLPKSAQLGIFLFLIALLLTGFSFWIFSSNELENPTGSDPSQKMESCSGRIILYTKPTGAKVFISKDYLGKTPYTYRGKCGTRLSLRFKLKGYAEEIRPVMPQENPLELTIRLRPLPRRQTYHRRRRRRRRYFVRIHTRPSRAYIYRHRKRICRTPCTLSSYHRGRRTYFIKKRGYFTKKIRVFFSRRRHRRLYRLRRRH